VGGELDTRLDAERDRDLAPLADAFNDMVDDLRDRLDREARFASDVTHELRGPLTVLASAVNIVERRRDQLPPEAAQAVDALDAQVIAFNRLVLDLLEISRFEVGTAKADRREVDVEQFLRASLAERDAPPPLRVGLGTATTQALDPRRMHQVVANLLDNAANYAGGATAVVAERTDGGALRIAVEDAGPGIAADEREAVFGRFARGTTGTSAGAPRGSGLGLALCADHVRLHGGRIWVEDAPTGGARFVVELPAGEA
jgi:signal transduction histidine kinase